jgi:hypothetical protein
MSANIAALLSQDRIITELRRLKAAHQRPLHASTHPYQMKSTYLVEKRQPDTSTVSTAQH